MAADEIAKDVAEKIIAEQKETKPLVGCVERKLNMQDRRLIITAVTTFLKSDNRNDMKGAVKRERILKALVSDSVDEYYDELQDTLTDRMEPWLRATNAYNKAMETGKLISPRPPRKAPDATPDEIQGPVSTFHIPAKLDVLITDALKAMKWENLSRYVVELGEKYGIPLED